MRLREALLLGILVTMLGYLAGGSFRLSSEAADWASCRTAMCVAAATE